MTTNYECPFCNGTGGYDEPGDKTTYRELVEEIIAEARHMTNYNDWIKYKTALARAITAYDKEVKEDG